MKNIKSVVALSTGGLRQLAEAAAGSDAHMNGCSLPVITNSGSGNQGITSSVLPAIIYTREPGGSLDHIARTAVNAMAINSSVIFAAQIQLRRKDCLGGRCMAHRHVYVYRAPVPTAATA